METEKILELGGIIIGSGLLLALADKILKEEKENKGVKLNNVIGG